MDLDRGVKETLNLLLNSAGYIILLVLFIGCSWVLGSILTKNRQASKK